MRDNSDFDNIIGAMGGEPPPLTPMPAPPPPTRKEKTTLTLKVLAASILLFWVQSFAVAILTVLMYGLIAEEFGLAHTGIAVWPTFGFSALLIAIVATIRRATTD